MHNAKFYLTRRPVSKDTDPVLASKSIPTWLKKAKPYVEPRNMGDKISPTSHAKRCVPLIEATSLGYMFLAPEDVIISLEGDAPYVRLPRVGYYLDDAIPEDSPITRHNPDQASTFFDGYDNKEVERWVFKYTNPYVIVAEKGYDLLFTSPLNGDYSNIEFFSGLVNTTDGHFIEINMPFYVKPGVKEVHIKRGQPLFQIIPIKRERYGLKVYRDVNRKVREKIDESHITYSGRLQNTYRDLFWNKAGKDAKKPWYQWFKRG